MTTKWFESNLSLDDLKYEYRKLIKKHHPDLGGDEEVTKEIINEYEKLISYAIDTGFKIYQADRERSGKERYDSDLTPFYKVLKKVMDFRDKELRIEIIGYWIYCFKSFRTREDLKSLGFWYSQKHKAWVYNGRKYKKFLRTRLSLNQIKASHGVEVINPDEEKEEELKKLLTIAKQGE